MSQNNECHLYRSTGWTLARGRQGISIYPRLEDTTGMSYYI